MSDSKESKILPSFWTQKKVDKVVSQAFRIYGYVSQEFTPGMACLLDVVFHAQTLNDRIFILMEALCNGKNRER